MKGFRIMKILKQRRIGFICAAIGICMILLGVNRGELSVVFTKAINICLECIGIG